jgi:hypothetical protein
MRNSQGKALSRVLRYRLMVQSSSPARGCSTDNLFFNRHIHSRAYCMFRSASLMAVALSDPQAMAVHHEQEKIAPSAVMVFPGVVERLFDFRFAEEIPGPFVDVRRSVIFTFYILPVGH